MKRLLMLIGALALCHSAPLQAADLVFVGVELPTSYSFDTADDGGSLESESIPSGVVVTASLPVIGGFGFEAYDVTLKNQGEHKISYLLVDYFYTFPIPFVNLSVGGGLGTATLKGDYGSEYERATAYQMLFQLGLPITDTVRLLASYKKVEAQMKYIQGDEYLEAGGYTSSLGASIGF